MPGPAEAAALARIPDLPQWVDTRGMLLSGRAVVSFPPQADLSSDGFIVELASRALLSAVGDPPAALVAERALAMAGDVNLLCLPQGTAPVMQALPDWVAHAVLLQELPGVMAWEAEDEPGVAVLTLADAPPLAHVAEALRTELTEALEGYPSARFVPGTLPPRSPQDAAPAPVPVAMAMADDVPVAFCYPVLQTETLWDVSVDTLPGYRGRRLAARAARAMTRYLRARGKAPVWGALESNAASLSVARQLGFVPAGRLVVFTPRR